MDIFVDKKVFFLTFDLTQQNSWLLVLNNRVNLTKPLYKDCLPFWSVFALSITTMT